MKNRFMYLLYCSVLTLICLSVKAQSIALKAPQTSIVIDGDKKDWGDNFIYNAEKHLYYNLANDKQNLYLVLKTDDESQQASILSGGVTFSIDTKGRKKISYSTTFPLPGHETYRGPAKTLEEKRLRADAAQLRKIGVKGFKDIDTKELNFENNTGIQTDVNFDDNGTLIYEEAIPLALFHADDISNAEWSFNIRLNNVTSSIVEMPPGQPGSPVLRYSTVTIAVPAGSGPPSQAAIEDAIRGSVKRQPGGGTISSVPRSSMPTNETEVSKWFDFWGKFTLAKQ